jgi:hypothetical protein
MMDKIFDCVTTKVLVDCSTQQEYYTSDSLVIDGIPIVIGITIFALINGKYVCATYDRDDDNISSNSNVTEIISIYNTCQLCIPQPTQTPTVTSTSTPLVTLTNTSTQTPTPTPTKTIGLTPQPTKTPTPTPNSTQTPSTTTTPTQTPSSSMVYVYESCYPVTTNSLTKVTQIVQTQSASTITIGQIFKDNNKICWTYLGPQPSSYIPPTTVFVSTYSGNYFNGAPTNTYGSCSSCVASSYKITLTNGPCSGPNSTFSITGGNVNDVIVVKAIFAGQLTKLSGNFARADLYLNGYGCSSNTSSTCYTDTNPHGFNISTTCTITMPATTTTITTNATVNNSSDSATNMSVAIVSINGVTVGSISATGCKANSTNGGIC